MGQQSDDQNFEEFMDSSAEEWSKPEEPAPHPEVTEDHDRWGSPEPPASDDSNRWGSEPLEPSRPVTKTQNKKANNKWWIVALVVVLLVCLCVCLVLLGVSIFGVNLFQGNTISF